MFFRSDCQNLANIGGKRVGLHTGLCGDRKPKATEVVVLIVVAVPASVVLLNMERQDDPLFMLDRFVGEEDCLARLIAPTGVGIDSPSGITVAVDRILNGTVDAPFAALVVKD